MNLGIDIGSTKTVIYSTLEQGTIIEDEFGKREINTVLERTRPVRSFGKSVSGDQLSNLTERRRFFLENILEEENQENTFMFLNYLNRIIQLKTEYKDCCLAIPETFNENQKQILKSLVEKSNLKVGSFLTHLTSVAACAALRNLQISECFMIIDCGYSKTSVGIFKFKDNKLTPIKRWFISLGGRNFDEAVNTVLIKKYNLPDSSITREKIYKEINTIKRGLNDLPQVNTRIFTEDYQICNMTITKDEYLEKLQATLAELREFFSKLQAETKFEGYIEVVGNNSNNAYIQQILKDVSFKTTLSSSESAALGACLAHGVNTRKMQFKVEEITGTEISVKLENEDVKPTVVFNAFTPITNEITKIKYLKKTGFGLEVFENGIQIGVIRINKKETESPEKVSIRVRTSPFLTFEMEGIDGGSEVSYVYDSFKLNDERIDQIKKTEESYRSTEVEIKMLAEKRNELENLLDSFDGYITKTFPSMITVEDKKRIDEIRDEFFDLSPVTKTIQEELELKNSLLERLSFVGDKIKAIEKSIRDEGEEILKQYDSKISKELTHNTIALRNLNGYVYNLRGYFCTFSLNLENVQAYDPNAFENLKRKIATGIDLAKVEQIREINRVKEEEMKAKKNATTKDSTSDGCCKDKANAGTEEPMKGGCCKGKAETGAEEAMKSGCCKNKAGAEENMNGGCCKGKAETGAKEAMKGGCCKGKAEAGAEEAMKGGCCKGKSTNTNEDMAEKKGCCKNKTAKSGNTAGSQTSEVEAKTNEENSNKGESQAKKGCCKNKSSSCSAVEENPSEKKL